MSNERLFIEPIPAFEDNYIWLLHNTHEAAVIDPGDAHPVLKALSDKSLHLTTILITHHHTDHIGGVNQLCQTFQPEVYAPRYEQYDFNHTALQEGDTVILPALDIKLDVIWLPGHTLGHIAYVNEQSLFCGDVLFGAGCGRIFEGTPQQMLRSLNRLKQLPPQTKVYCTHEYTAKNIEFALTIEPDNPDLQQRYRETISRRQANQATLPSTIGLEQKTNPFLRCNEKTIIDNAHSSDHDELSVFSKIRALRNHY